MKEFCEVQYGLDLPMSEITHVRGQKAHAFYASLRDEHGFTPSWNFNKVLIGKDGEIVGTFGSRTRPFSSEIVDALVPLLD